MKPLSKIIFSSFLLALSISSFAQNVSLEGKQFKINGTNYYPVIINYGIEPVYNTTSTDYYISPVHMYGANNSFECFDYTGCNNSIQSDFNNIACMGFNTVRIAGCYPKYVAGTGLIFRFSLNTQSGNQDVLLDPTNSSDPGMLLIIPFFKKILELANATVNNISLQPAPLKIIFIITGNMSNYDPIEQSAFNSYAGFLASHLATDPNINALFAYDLMNEPCYHDIPVKTKEEACNMINSWYTTIHIADPSHLITLGSCGVSDVFEFDPSIIKVDFLSLHTYPYWMPYEDKTIAAIQQRAWDRTAIDMFWLNRNGSVPWIIGETSLSADQINAPLQGITTDGTETQQSAYAQFSLDATCNCGGSGHSWWVYQDACHLSGNDASSFMGLLRMCPNQGEKPVVNNVFRVYAPPASVSSCSPCPVNYNSTYNSSLLYYNPFQHPSNPSKTITGTITDQDGNPIKDAVFGAHTFVDPGPTSSPNDDVIPYETTFSDENGHFEIIPYDYISPFTGGIVNIRISAAGAERLNYGWCCNAIPTNNIINCTLNQINFSYNTTINNITVPASTTRNFKGYNSLTASNITIQSNANSQLTARNEIHLLSEFHASSGSEVHIFCTPTFSDCSDFNSYVMQRLANNSGSETDSDKEIEIDFNGTSNLAWLKIYPNPNNGNLIVSLVSVDNQKIGKLKICDVLGKEIISTFINETNYAINLNDNPKGMYFLEVTTSNQIFTKKIIIQ